MPAALASGVRHANSSGTRADLRRLDGGAHDDQGLGVHGVLQPLGLEQVGVGRVVPLVVVMIVTG